MPPPPRIKHNHAIKQDGDFESPMKRQGFDRQNFDADDFRAQRRNAFRKQFQDGGRFGGGNGQSGMFARRNGITGGDGLGRFGGDGRGFGGGRLGGPNGDGSLQGRPALGFSERAGAAGSRLGAGFGAEGMPAARGGFGGAGLARARRAAGMSGLPGARKPLDLRPLNLSDEQKDRIRQIRAQTRSDARALRGQLQDSQKQLRSLLFSPDASDAQIKQARQQLREAQNRLDDLNLNDWLQMRKVLTADQRQRLPLVAPNQGGANRPAAQVSNAPASSPQQ